MKTGPAKRDNGQRRRALRETPAAQARRGTAEFLPSFIALQKAVDSACDRQTGWEARIAAAVRAALDFAAADPAAARALTINARRQASEHGDHEREMIAHFAAHLGKVTPDEARFPISTDEGTIESIAITIRGHLLAGKAAQLPKVAADLIYLILMPYTGSEGAKRWSQTADLSRSA